MMMAIPTPGETATGPATMGERTRMLVMAPSTPGIPMKMQESRNVPFLKITFLMGPTFAAISMKTEMEISVAAESVM